MILKKSKVKVITMDGFYQAAREVVRISRV